MEDTVCVETHSDIDKPYMHYPFDHCLWRLADEVTEEPLDDCRNQWDEATHNIIFIPHENWDEVTGCYNDMEWDEEAGRCTQSQKGNQDSGDEPYWQNPFSHCKVKEMPNAETATEEEIVDAEFEQAQMEEAALVADTEVPEETVVENITEPLTTES